MRPIGLVNFFFTPCSGFTIFLIQLKLVTKGNVTKILTVVPLVLAVICASVDSTRGQQIILFHKSGRSILEEI